VKRLSLVIFSCLVLAGFASQSVAARSTTPEAAKVRALLLYEVGLTFVARMRVIRAALGPFTLRNLAVRVRGQRAFVTYQIIGRGKVVGGAPAREPDVFVRIAGRWFYDFDAQGECP
jgi:hypothetical protein